jgi:hypothetical protein
LTQVTSDQIFGQFTFSIDTGLQLRLREERGQIEIRLEADVNGGRRDEALDAREQHVGAEKVVQEMMRPPGRQTRRISSATFTGSGRH